MALLHWLFGAWISSAILQKKAERIEEEAWKEIDDLDDMDIDAMDDCEEEDYCEEEDICDSAWEEYD